MRGKRKFIKAHLDTAKEYDNDAHDPMYCLMCDIGESFSAYNKCANCTLSNGKDNHKCIHMTTFDVINYKDHDYYKIRNIWRAKFHREFVEYLNTIDPKKFMDYVRDGSTYDMACKIDTKVYNDYLNSRNDV